MKLDFYDRYNEIELLGDMYGLSATYYTALKPNFTEILDASRLQEEKADLLARAAIASVTQETYEKGLDGIQYLSDNFDAGVITELA